jgi:RHS repeat-associated protein
LFQYDGGGHLLEESDGQGNPKADYVYVGGRPVAEITPSSGKIYFFNDDRLGTPQVATDSTQSTVWMANYLPFGGLGSLPYSLTQDIRLPGQEFDIETGLYHNGFRDYVSGLGRYAESDPIGLAGGLGAYTYAGGNPESDIDPLGLAMSFISSIDGNLGGSMPIVRNFSAEETSAIIAEASQKIADANLITRGPLLITLHGQGGEYDYFGNKLLGGETHTFNVNGIIMDDSQFGNYLAGYDSYLAYGVLGIPGVKLAGYGFSAIDVLKGIHPSFDFEQPCIEAGIRDAIYLELAKWGIETALTKLSAMTVK